MSHSLPRKTHTTASDNQRDGNRTVLGKRVAPSTSNSSIPPQKEKERRKSWNNTTSTMRSLFTPNLNLPQHLPGNAPHVRQTHAIANEKLAEIENNSHDDIMHFFNFQMDDDMLDEAHLGTAPIFENQDVVDDMDEIQGTKGHENDDQPPAFTSNVSLDQEDRLAVCHYAMKHVVQWRHLSHISVSLELSDSLLGSMKLWRSPLKL